MFQIPPTPQTTTTTHKHINKEIWKGSRMLRHVQLTDKVTPATCCLVTPCCQNVTTLTLTHKTDITLTYIHPSAYIPCSCIQTSAPTADQNQHKFPEIQSLQLQASDCIQSNDMHVDWAQTTEYLWQYHLKWVTLILSVILRCLYDNREHKRIFKIMQKLSKLVNWSGYYNNLKS